MVNLKAALTDHQGSNSGTEKSLITYPTNHQRRKVLIKQQTWTLTQVYHSCLLTHGFYQAPGFRPVLKRRAGYTLTHKHFLKGLHQTLISDQAKVDLMWTVIHKIYMVNRKSSSLDSRLIILDSTSKDKVSVSKSGDGLIWVTCQRRLEYNAFSQKSCKSDAYLWKHTFSFYPLRKS